MVNWAAGRFIERFRDRRWFPANREQLERAQAWFRRYGIWSLLFAWLPVVGEPLTVVAGAMRVRIAPFLILVAIGKGLRYVVLALAVEGVFAPVTGRCQFSSPAERIASFTRSFVASVGSTSGSRTSGEHLPSTLAAYFTGPGLVSEKSASCSGMRRC